MYKFILMLFMTACGVQPAKTNPRVGPIYVEFNDKADGIRLGSWDVLNEFNNQLGHQFFSKDGQIDTLSFLMMPDNTPRLKDGECSVFAWAPDAHLIQIYDNLNLPTDYFYDLIVHEIGHTMGLEHTTDPSNVMTPGFNQVVPMATAVTQVIYAAHLQ